MPLCKRNLITQATHPAAGDIAHLSGMMVEEDNEIQEKQKQARIAIYGM
jgi:hypothetical protein